MRNVHTREMNARIEDVRPWIEACWTGTNDDPFPRDVLKTWRKNPPGDDRLALIPDVTRVGHGPFAFRFTSWDGNRWRVRVESKAFAGWHGFDLDPTERGCRVTHTIELDLSGSGRVIWPVCIAAIHDWAVEALLDRMEEALRTGTVPAVTARKMPFPASVWFAVLGRVLRAGREKKSGDRTVSTSRLVL